MEKGSERSRVAEPDQGKTYNIGRGENLRGGGGQNGGPHVILCGKRHRGERKRG